MTVTINGTSGVTAPEVTLDNGTSDGGQVVLASSGSSNWNLDNYSGTFRAYYGGTEYFKVSSSGDLQMNSGYGSVATAYGCRAWVNFNGTGTVAIRASGNVSSITDNGTGSYTVNFTNAMPDANYAVVCCLRPDGGSGRYDTTIINGGTAPTSSAVRINTGISSYGVDNYSLDELVVCVAIFR